MRASELRAILRGRDFCRLYGTRLASQLTDGVFQVALAGYVFFSPERQTTAGKAAAAFAVTLLPYSALGPFAGVLIDRWRRRRILIWTPVVRALLTVLVAALVAAGQDGAVFFVTVLVVLGVNRFFLAALSAALPHVVRREHLVTANAFAVTSGTVIAFAGAGLGYLMRRMFGPHDDGTALILLGAAALWVAAALVATSLPRRLLGPHLERAAPHTREALGNVLHGLVDGARHMLGNGPAALSLAAISVHRFLYGIVLIMTLLLCRYHFTTDPDAGMAAFALMLGVSGAGYFAAALVTPPVVRRVGKAAWTVWLLAGGGVVLLVLGLPFAQGPWVVGAFLLGVVSQGVKLCVDTTLQESIEDAYRGRVFAVYDMLFNATFAAAAAVAATWLPADGVSYATLVAVVAAYLLAAVAFRTCAARLSRVPTTT
ncbi:MFS transporter [Actinomadura sp. NBRC 104425]|uniref:MFS transporter n=1 Tax=Actinomadura sp. NBRC 104425 TaxID=3032204 RepID=UPI0024A1BEEA|nr:MFS transporter [Actinomadura sp. NBRC 104425]GLZ14842.1 MFS transporter [Actinomadura sp. NBRC 104425]